MVALGSPDNAFLTLYTIDDILKDLSDVARVQRLVNYAVVKVGKVERCPL
jgi:hypothetical protein